MTNSRSDTRGNCRGAAGYRDGEEIEPSNKFKGQRGRTRSRPSVASTVDARKMERDQLAKRSKRNTETFRCPECRVKHDDRASEADCLREHARDWADRLQQLADDGHDVLPMGAGA